VSCDVVREQLPDFTLGTLTTVEDASIRRHLRGCATCRADAEKLDHGMALFASAAHESDPPAELEGRVMRVLAEEWHAEPDRPRRPSAAPTGWRRPLIPLAAAFVLFAGALGWGVVNQVRASHAHADAAALRDFLDTLGGKDVRVGTLHPESNTPLQGSFVIYDGSEGRGESWVLVLVRAPGFSGPARVTLLSHTARPIPIRPIVVEDDGEGWTALFTNADLSGYDMIRLVSPDGRPLATGAVIRRD
jgi:hypothetical protein